MNGHPTRQEEFDLYALGAFEGEEKQTIETHVASCPECARALAEARGRMALLALAAPEHSPPPRVKERLLEQVREEGRFKTARKPTPKPSLLAQWWGAAWAPAAAVLAIATIYLWVSNNRLNRELEDLRIATEQQRVQQDKSKALIALVTAGDTVAVTLNPTPELPGAQGRVLYNERLGMVLYHGTLPAPPAEKTYQLWLVPVSGNPVSAGIFTPKTSGESSMILTPLPPGIAAKAFAVTVEPAGGKPQPTGPKVLIGATS
jgi:anti-sigma-K factor RskA